jgi:hypothetical protein
MMGYLQANSRPDISFAVSQCARFASAPRRSHELALIRVGQYLKKTADKGLILRRAKMSSRTISKATFMWTPTLQAVGDTRILMILFVSRVEQVLLSKLWTVPFNGCPNSRATLLRQRWKLNIRLSALQFVLHSRCWMSFDKDQIQLPSLTWQCSGVWTSIE